MPASPTDQKGGIKLPRPKNNKLSTKEKPFDFILIVCVLVMLSLGIIMVLSASSPSSLAEGSNGYSYAIRQGAFGILGLVLMYIISKIDYRIYKKFYKIAYWVSIVLLLAVLIPGLRWEAGGAARWIYIAPLRTTVQPSEFAKIALVLFFATYLTDNREKLGEKWEGFFRPLLYLAPIILILLGVQSHLSASILIIAVIAIMMIMAGSKIRYFLTYGTVGIAAAGGVMYFMAKVLEKGTYRIARLTSFLDPWADPTGSGYQVIQGLYAIGSRRAFWSGAWE